MPTSPPLLLRLLAALPRARIVIGTCFLALIILVAAFYLEENWRGANEWAACQRELAAKGETLDRRAFIPPPIPDEQNLAMAPLFVRALAYRFDPKTHVLAFGPASEHPGDLKEMFAAGARPPGLAPAGWELTRHTDLPAYQQFYRKKTDYPHAPRPQSPAEDVLLALTRYAPVLDELAQAATQRSLTRFPVTWEADNPSMTALPQYQIEQQFVQILRLRASADIAAGHTQDAVRDLELSWRLCGDMRKDPALIAQIVEITCLSMTLTPVWEGLADRHWSAVELARLQADLQRFDVLADFVATFRGERTLDLPLIDFLEKQRDLTQTLAIINSPGNDPPKTNLLERLAYHVAPRGWFDLNKVTLARLMQQYLIEGVSTRARRFFVPRLKAAVLPPEMFYPTVANLLVRTPNPFFGGMGSRSARMQTGVDEAATACALEQFFLDHQSYPDRLDALVPGYMERIPTDAIDGKSLRYHPTPDGRYQLYSVGWNGRDDGGTAAWYSTQTRNYDAGDWVWQYAELKNPRQGK